MTQFLAVPPPTTGIDSLASCCFSYTLWKISQDFLQTLMKPAASALSPVLCKSHPSCPFLDEKLGNPKERSSPHGYRGVDGAQLCNTQISGPISGTKETFGCLLSQSRANKEPREVGQVQKKSGEEVTAGGKLYEEIPMIYSEKLGLLRYGCWFLRKWLTLRCHIRKRHGRATISPEVSLLAISSLIFILLSTASKLKKVGWSVQPQWCLGQGVHQESEAESKGSRKKEPNPSVDWGARTWARMVSATPKATTFIGLNPTFH